jgi:hypothetical protein
MPARYLGTKLTTHMTVFAIAHSKNHKNSENSEKREISDPPVQDERVSRRCSPALLVVPAGVCDVCEDD